VDQIRYGHQVQNQSIGRVGASWRLLAGPTVGGPNTTTATLGAAEGLRFNEWMANPLTGGDWFELYNASLLPVELSGLYLSDSPAITRITNSPIAPLSFVGGRRWVLFRAEGESSSAGDRAAFSLAAAGETLRLYHTNLALLDAVDFGVQAAGVSQGRLPDGTAQVVSFATTASPAGANYLPLTNVVINEILSHTDPPLEDAIELHNPGPAPVDIGGWYLSDRSGEFQRYRIPDGTTIPAQGFKVFYQYQFGPPDGEADVPPLFSFNSARGDAAYLSAVDGSGQLTGHRTGVVFDAAANGVSLGRHITSVGIDFVPLSAPSFGVNQPVDLAQFRSGSGATNAAPLVGPVVVNEIMYHPADFGTNTPAEEEYIELLNITGTVVPLFDPAHPTNVWRLTGAVRFEFATNLTLAPGVPLVVVGFHPTNSVQREAFRSRYGTNGTLVGPFSGRLDNAGDTIELWRPDTPQAPPHPDAGWVPQLLVERVRYADLAPWPSNADGGGASLQRITAHRYGNDPLNWVALPPTPGQTLDVTDADGDGMPDRWELQNRTDPLASDGQEDPDQDHLLNWQEFRAGTDPQSAASCLKLEAERIGSGHIQLRFTAVAHRSYSVLYRDTLTDSWRVLGSYDAQSADRLETLLDVPGTGTRFYRLVTPRWSVGQLSALGDGRIQVSFPVEPGRSYQVQYTDDLADPQWRPLGTPVAAPTPILTAIDEMRARPHRFYRLLGLP
jgi:hypothetical protein